ncbi:MAG: metallophosphoesterase, partial [Parachlamydiaceae bacterium]
DEIKIREKKGGEWHELSGSSLKMPYRAPYLIHSVEAVSLKPDTFYEIEVDNTLYFFKTAPLDLPIRFVDGGDVYHDDIKYVDEMSQIIAKYDPLFAIVGGDLAYPDKSKGKKYGRWLEFIKSYSLHMRGEGGRLIPMVPVIGNHDVDSKGLQNPSKAPYFYHIFALPETGGYRTLDFNAYLSLFLLDTNHTNPIAGNQSAWLKEALDKREKIPYKFASYHVPAYPSHRNFTNEISRLVRKHFVPLFEEAKLTAAFEHHDHLYKRTFPILQDAPHKDGVVYVGDGAWGIKKPREPKKTWYLEKAMAARHVILIDVDNEKAVFRAIDSKGEVIDSFTREALKK